MTASLERVLLTTSYLVYKYDKVFVRERARSMAYTFCSVTKLSPNLISLPYMHVIIRSQDIILLYAKKVTINFGDNILIVLICS